MPFALLCLLQSSLLVSPQYLEQPMPEGRALRAIVVIHRATPGASRAMQRSPEEARAIAQSLSEELAHGADFADLARRRSEHASARLGGLLGTVWPGMLPPEVDRFLFSAEVGQASGVVETKVAFWLVQRIERDVAWRQIQVDGTGPDARARCNALLERLRAGEDFAALAKAESSDSITAARGGIAGRFQRGSRDALLKAAAFDAPLGEIVGPVETPFALFVLQRLDPHEIDPALCETSAARARGILLAFKGAEGASEELTRTLDEAEQLANGLKQRIEAGEDMVRIARELDDDPGGRERGGDLGWILDHASAIPAPMEALFRVPVGELIGPFSTNNGWVLVRRER
jgi:parvulin-like peptidyl-prolyl isomerase